MKKIIAFVLTLALAAAMSVTAFADTSINQDSDPKTGSITVNHLVDPFYTVTIPASVDLGATATITASDVVVPNGKSVVVTVSGTGDNGAFTVASGTNKLTYTISDASKNQIALGGEVLSVNPTTASSGSATISFSEPIETAQYSGNYTGTVTFTVALADAA